MTESGRTALSHGCAAVGVLLLVGAGLTPADWHPEVPLLLGLVLLAAAHVLTPCEGRITVWKKTRTP